MGIINRIIIDRIRYNNWLGIIVIIQIFSLIGLYKFTFNKLEYKSIEGSVDSIKMGKYPTKKTSIIQFKEEYNYAEGIEIKLNEKEFYVDLNEKEKWGIILKKIKNGDFIRIYYYHFADRNLNNIHGLETKNEKILKVEERNKPIKYVLASLLFILIVSTIFLIFIVKKRIDFIKEGI